MNISTHHTPAYAVFLFVSTLLMSVPTLANNLIWVPSVVNYIQTQGMNQQTPSLESLPSEDTDGNLLIEWQGTSAEYLLEMSSIPSLTESLTGIQGAASMAKFMQTLTKSSAYSTTDEDSTQWQTVYSGSESSVEITELTEGDYQFRVSGCEDNTCSEADVSDVVTVKYAITPIDDTGYVMLNENVLIDVLANDSDPTQPELSIYAIAESIELYSHPMYGQISIINKKLQYTNDQQDCTSSDAFYDTFDYQIVDRNGEYSSTATVTVQVKCSNAFVLPTWVDLPSGSTTSQSYTLHQSSDGYFLKARASQWASMGFLTIPIYQEGDFIALSYVDGEWQTTIATQSEFNAAVSSQLTNSILAYGDRNSAIQLDLAEGESIEISWPDTVPGQAIEPQKILPTTVSCELSNLSTNRYTEDAGSFRFYQAGTHNVLWECTDTATSSSYIVDSLVNVNWLNAPLFTTSQE